MLRAPITLRLTRARGGALAGSSDCRLEADLRPILGRIEASRGLAQQEILLGFALAIPLDLRALLGDELVCPDSS
jgi:hypothetical protein